APPGAPPPPPAPPTPPRHRRPAPPRATPTGPPNHVGLPTAPSVLLDPSRPAAGRPGVYLPGTDRPGRLPGGRPARGPAPGRLLRLLPRDADRARRHPTRRHRAARPAAPAAVGLGRPGRWPARAGRYRRPARPGPYHAVAVRGPAVGRIPGQGCPGVVLRSDRAGGRHAEAGVRGQWHRVSPARPGRVPAGRAGGGRGPDGRELRAHGAGAAAHLEPGAGPAVPLPHQGRHRSRRRAGDTRRPRGGRGGPGGSDGARRGAPPPAAPLPPGPSPPP